MSIEYEKPTLVKDSTPHLGDSIETHPAYAQIGASRVSGHAFLYGSDFSHQNYVTISIHRSKLHRGLSNDWAHPQEELIEVALSEAQWAAFVSSPNQGSGVQCTLQHHGGKMIPQIPELKNRQDQFYQEMLATVDKALKAVAEARDTVETSKLSGKAKDELKSKLDYAEMNISSNIKFVAEQFGEHVEAVTEHAKVEVNAYITAAIMRSGIAALKGTSPLTLTDERKKDQP